MTEPKQEPLFYLFFKRVKQQRPKLFYFFLSCCGLQLAFTALKLEATPFLLYGMYSEKQAVPDTVKTVTVYLDHTPLDSFPFFTREKDLLLTGIENYLAMKRNGNTDVVQTRVEQRYSFVANSKLYPLIRERIYNKPDALVRFEAWFKQKCSRLANRRINTITLTESRYIIDPETLAVAAISHEPIASF